MTPKQLPLLHGIPSVYTNHGCRCADCREAWRRYRLAARVRARTRRPAASGIFSAAAFSRTATRKPAASGHAASCPDVGAKAGGV
jgi:hypothetical protein